MDTEGDCRKDGWDGITKDELIAMLQQTIEFQRQAINALMAALAAKSVSGGGVWTSPPITITTVPALPQPYRPYIGDPIYPSPTPWNPWGGTFCKTSTITSPFKPGEIGVLYATSL